MASLSLARQKGVATDDIASSAVTRFGPLELHRGWAAHGKRLRRLAPARVLERTPKLAISGDEGA